MKLKNFQLEKESHAIALKGLGKYWDLHAYAELESVRYGPDYDGVELIWKVPRVENPWGDLENTAEGCLLRFSNVHLLKIIGTDNEVPQENRCVSSISQIDRKEPISGEPVEFRMRRNWQGGEEFGFFIILQSGRTIEIQALSAELEELVWEHGRPSPGSH